MRTVYISPDLKASPALAITQALVTHFARRIPPLHMPGHRVSARLKAGLGTSIALARIFPAACVRQLPHLNSHDCYKRQWSLHRIEPTCLCLITPMISTFPSDNPLKLDGAPVLLATILKRHKVFMMLKSMYNKLTGALPHASRSC